MVAGHNHKLSPVCVDFTEELSKGIYLFGFRRKFDFIAGQAVGIALKENGPRRLYSICSGEDETHIKILYNVIDQGYLTPRLSDLKVGNTLWITEPRGEFEAVLRGNYIRCCSGEHDESVYHGRVTGFIEEESELNPLLKYYLCGNAEMVVETRDILIKKSIPFHQIISEIYF